MRELKPGEARARSDLVVFECRCARCDHKFRAIGDERESGGPPARCPKCRSPYWTTKPGDGRPRGRPSAAVLALEEAMRQALEREGHPNATVSILRFERRGQMGRTLTIDFDPKTQRSTDIRDEELDTIGIASAANRFVRNAVSTLR